MFEEKFVETCQSLCSPLPTSSPARLPSALGTFKTSFQTSKDAHDVHTSSPSAPPELDKLLHPLIFSIQTLCLNVCVLQKYHFLSLRI